MRTLSSLGKIVPHQTLIVTAFAVATTSTSAVRRGPCGPTPGVFIYILPILYGPYFAEISKGVAPGLGLAMPVVFSVVLVSLDHIQEHLENPFDQVGQDDVIINVEKFLSPLDP